MLNILVSLLLTYFLVTLYNQQSSLLRTQAEAEQKPILRGPLKYVDDELYGYELVLSNVGKGIALDVKLVVELELDPELEVNSKKAVWELHREEEFDSEVIPTDMNYLKAGESEIPFKARHSLYVDENPDELTAPKPFENVTGILADADHPVEFQRMRMSLVYEDNLGNEFSDDFADLVFPIKGKTGFLPAMNKMVSYEVYENMREVAKRKRDELEMDSALESASDADTE
jgi:hypothetical protein